MKVARKYWLKRLKSNHKERSGYTSWEDVKSLGIVVRDDNSQALSDVHSFMESLKSVGVETQLLILSREKMTKKKEEARRKSVLYANESNWKGIPSSDEFNAFIQQKYDVVLHLCKTVDGFAEYLPYMFETKLLVGSIHYEDDAIDLRLDIEKRSTKTVLEDAVNWLKKIRNVA